jgi:hypothetical protein
MNNNYNKNNSNINATSNSSGLEWRRSKVQELASQGYNQSEISRSARRGTTGTKSRSNNESSFLNSSNR